MDSMDAASIEDVNELDELRESCDQMQSDVENLNKVSCTLRVMGPLFTRDTIPNIAPNCSTSQMATDLRRRKFLGDLLWAHYVGFIVHGCARVRYSHFGAEMRCLLHAVQRILPFGCCLVRTSRHCVCAAFGLRRLV